jgi:hypothetical protein
MLMLLSLVSGGTIVTATIGTAAADWRNNDHGRFNATARCSDGTWSWSKQADPCAQHGGVTR